MTRHFSGRCREPLPLPWTPLAGTLTVPKEAERVWAHVDHIRNQHEGNYHSRVGEGVLLPRAARMALASSVVVSATVLKSAGRRAASTMR